MVAQTETIAVEYPTGYTSAALPFYTELDAQLFEQFCTALLNLQPAVTILKNGKATQRKLVEANRLGSGTAQKGADIRAKDDQGAVWFFQCKHTQSFGESQVSEAIDLAEQGLPQADQFVLVTTCALSLKAQEKLHARPNWLWWDASRLTTEVLRLKPREDAINLVHQFFGADWKKRLFTCGDQPLLTWREFFQQDLNDSVKHFRHTIPFVAWSDALEKLESFAQSGGGRALIVTAAGGQGKSRLLLELAHRIEKVPRAPRVRFLNLNRHGLSDEQSDFLSREEGDLLLIVDDAHRMDAAIQDVARAAYKVNSIRLVVATRPQAVEAIKSQLHQNGYGERLEEPLCLPSWHLEDIRKLAEHVLAPERRMQASVLVKLADRCPLLVVLGAALINSGENLGSLPDLQAFRERVFKSFKDDFLRGQPEPRRERLNRVLGFLSFVSPTPKNGTLMDKASEILGCSALHMDEDLGLLETAGLIVENREGIRLYPDLFADAVLMDACLDPRNRRSELHKSVLGKLKLDDFPMLLRNIAQADWEARSRKGALGSLFDPIWREFVSRFEKASWPHARLDFLERYLKRLNNLDPDRSEMLGQWAAAAIFLPERTLELTEFAMKSESAEDRASAGRDLPPLLKSIVVSHPAHAKKALDLLWSLATLDADSAKAGNSAAIATIADAAVIAFHKPIEVTEGVLAWLEQKIQEGPAIERFRRQPWMLSALLKPFFVREVQAASYSAASDTVLISRLRLRAEKARPLRQRALSIIEKFLKSPDTLVGCAVVPVLLEAIKPNQEWRHSEAPNPDQESWRQCCLDVLKVIEGAVEAHKDSPILLLQLRGVLRNRRFLDQDCVLRGERDRLLKAIPDSLELRVDIVLTSYAQFEFPARSGVAAMPDHEESEVLWDEFTRGVVNEAVEKWKTARELCDFLRHAGGELKAINCHVNPGALLDPLVQHSPSWCAGLLVELLGTEGCGIARGLRGVLSRAVTAAPQAYRDAVEFLPTRGDAAQLCELIGFLGWKRVSGGGLAPIECEAVLAAAKRREENVVCELAWLCEVASKNDTTWAIDVLSQLEPSGERSADAVLKALGLVVEAHASDVEPWKVAQCLGKVGDHCFPEGGPTHFGLTILAEKFPKEVYEHLRSLCEETDPNLQLRRPHPGQIPSLGPLGDTEYVDREIRALWERAVASDMENSSQDFRLALIRSLLWADADTAPDRLGQLVRTCKNGNEIKLLAKLAGPQPSGFVFLCPDLVRPILIRGQEFGAEKEVTKTLLLSACGGSRTYADAGGDPVSNSILQQGEALANRYRGDPVLESFYRKIANWERSESLEWQQQRRNSDSP